MSICCEPPKYSPIQACNHGIGLTYYCSDCETQIYNKLEQRISMLKNKEIKKHEAKCENHPVILIDDQVVSVELAKLLRNKIPLKAIYHWGWSNCINDYALTLFPDRPDCIPAYSVAELMEALPAHIISHKHEEPFNTFNLEITKISTIEVNYIVNYKRNTLTFDGLPLYLTKNIYDSKLADALGKIYLFLYENNFIKE